MIGVYEQLRDRVVNGGYDDGAPLVELALAAEFQVSRTPIREALRRLEQDGLIERGARGMSVRSRSPEEILEIYEVRIVLEVAAVRAAAERYRPLELARLERLHETMQGIPVDAADRLAASNQAFHQLLWQMSHNETLVDVLAKLGAHLVRYRGTTLTYADRWATVLREHTALIDAIRAHDGDAAARICDAHMAGARNTRLRMFADRGHRGVSAGAARADATTRTPAARSPEEPT